MLIGTFVNAIYLYDDKAVIALNYKDGTKTVNFNDMECALSRRASIPGSDLEILSPPDTLKRLDFFGDQAFLFPPNKYRDDAGSFHVQQIVKVAFFSLPGIVSHRETSLLGKPKHYKPI